MNNADRIARILDRADIWDVVIGYASAVDLRDWDRWSSYLTDDVSIRLGKVGSVDGREACKNFASGALADIGSTQHLITNPEISFENDDTAHVRSVLMTLHTVEEEGVYHSLQGFGFYLYDMVRTTDGWRISGAEVQILHSVGDPHGRAAAGGARHASV
jgi:3-phenylpropionate/cinnamic acid dioxygenase small subunit